MSNIPGRGGPGVGGAVAPGIDCAIARLRDCMLSGAAWLVVFFAVPMLADPHPVPRVRTGSAVNSAGVEMAEKGGAW
jgi:hypothetical protein